MPADRLVYHDGELRQAATATLASSDPGFAVGDGLFETLRVDEGRAADVDAHLDRLYIGLATLEIAIPEARDELRRAVERVAAAAPTPCARLRLSVAAGAHGAAPTRIVEARAYTPPSPEEARRGVAVCVEPQLRVCSGDVLRQVKSLSWQRQALALRRARASGTWEALLLNQEGRVVEGTRCNVVARIGRKLVTPPLDEGCLGGTVRRRLLEAGAVLEAPIDLAALLEADGVLLTNSLIGVLPVRAVDGVSIPVDRGAAALAGVAAAGALT